MSAMGNIGWLLVFEGTRCFGGSKWKSQANPIIPASPAKVHTHTPISLRCCSIASSTYNYINSFLVDRWYVRIPSLFRVG